MCMFSRDVQHVAATKILCHAREGRHFTTYQMQVKSRLENAMILPVPGHDLEFINLEKAPKMFDRLNMLHFGPRSRTKSLSRGLGDRESRIPVQDVGAYAASWVPTMQDLSRLDPMFQLPELCWPQMPHGYDEGGFAVFQLKPTVGMQQVHPMAYNYKPFKREQLFYPTVHVHDGRVATTEKYDHDLYLCASETFRYQPNARWLKSDGCFNDVLQVGEEPEVSKVCDINATLFRFTLQTVYHNCDHILLGSPSGNTQIVTERVRPI